MNIAEFKIWFKGLTAGMTEGQALTGLQVKALREAVDSLGEEEVVPRKDDSPKGPPPASSPIPPAITSEDFQKIIDEMRRKQEERVEPLSWPYKDPGPHTWDPFRPTPPFGGRYEDYILNSDIKSMAQNVGDLLVNLGDFVEKRSLKH